MSSNMNSPVLYSPYDPNMNSPWSQGSPFGSDGSRYESLTLPPINTGSEGNSNLADLPDFMNELEYFELPPLAASPDPFLAQASTASRPQPPLDPSNSDSQPQRSLPLNNIPSQYRIGESESPDPWEADSEILAFFDQATRPSSPANMPPSRTTARRSSFVDLTSSPPNAAAAMVSTRKRKAESSSTKTEGRVSKKARKGENAESSRRQSLGDVAVVDLADVEDEDQYKELAAKQQAELFKKQNEDEANRPAKLADFQCIICMDNPTDLTVTHCGHLFCSECLHQALHAGDKKSCPVCRTPINTTPNKQGKQQKQGIFALEMKLLTKNMKGKRPAVS